mgnify:CR=1 FL=1
MDSKPLIGISTCLLGECVRYDGGHKLNRYLRDTLGQFVEFVPVCPEVECGMTTPREAMRLVNIDGDIRLMTQKSNIDMTPQMNTWMTSTLDKLQNLPLCGFIFKSKSPSSGLFRVKVYKNGNPVSFSKGIFAKGFTERFPLLPVEEEGRLNDSKLRENFIERVFAMHKWHELNKKAKSISNLVDFHTKHKYALMAHCPTSLKILGKLVANHDQDNIDKAYYAYFQEFITAMKNIATIQKNTNVLEHIMGYFKNELTSDEKQELKEIIHNYHSELVPLIVPTTIINHFVRKYENEYLQKQYYLNPPPKELMLRNHI